MSSKSRKYPLARVYNQAQGICWLCERFVPLEQATRDHVIPLAWGGGWGWNNLRLAHQRCNQLRGDALRGEDKAEAAVLQWTRGRRPQVTRRYAVAVKKKKESDDGA